MPAADAQANRTDFEYDGHDRLVKTFYPITTVGAGTANNGDYEQLTYDAAGNVMQRRLRDGQAVSYGYDNLNRLTSKDRPQSVWWETDHTYGYDLLGRLTSSTDGTQVITLGYDALGRKTSENSSWYGGVTSAYDVAGRRTSLTWHDGFYVSYDYLVTGEMSSIREYGPNSGGLVLATFGYDDLGRRVSLTRGNGTVTSYGYDGVSRLSSLAENLAGTGADVARTFSYNVASQISSTTRDNDAYAWTAHANVDRDYGVNGLNQLTSSGSTSLTYDSRGNVAVSNGLGYGYNVDNQLVGSPGGYFAFGPLDQLFHESASNSLLLYDGTDMVMERDAGTGAVRARYVFGPGIDEPLVRYLGPGTGAPQWLHADERGSLVAVTNGAGTTLATKSYDEFGIPGPGDVGRFQYTGQMWLPELGMYHYKARTYSPSLGRFMQTDPIGYSDGMNWYNYAASDPINRTDPTGLCAHDEYLYILPHENRAAESDGNGGVVVTAPPSMCIRIDWGQGDGGQIPGGGGGGGQLFPSEPRSRGFRPPIDKCGIGYKVADWGLWGVGLLGDGIAIAGLLTGNPLVAGLGKGVSIGASFAATALHAAAGDGGALAGDALGFGGSLVPGGGGLMRSYGARFDFGRDAAGRFVSGHVARREAQDALVKNAQGRYGSAMTNGLSSC